MSGYRGYCVREPLMRLKTGIIVTIAALFLLLAITSHKDARAQGACNFNQYNDFICPPGEDPTPGPNPFKPGGSGKPIIGSGPIVTTPPNVSDLPACDAAGGGGGFDQFIEHLKLREGVVNCVYKDTLGYNTVGVGHLVKPEDGLSEGDCISDAQVDAFLQSDAQWAWEAAQQQAAEAGVNDPCFVIALGSVNYQLGAGWRKKFPSTWNMIKNGQYCEAANALEGTLWNRQTPVRVDDFQAALREQAANAGTPC